ncbi:MULTISPECIES: oligopeptide/dipeptide ABC transporter ATP-binding protein [unclassified Chelatococcus]|uniref:ABC transporter ATP-binding protein n=1 Tax=unclassified Chelatococcus TaxID=2638111 RepID=UPI001BD19C92|nr:MULTISPECIES: oligopeptide/dipeptide ABC transporter ATP-binding protein [unclassified Chelatococcus]MBS7699635.1 ATP-binding cassette domain-containing protein [Chelatococcus sp. YT9]MBX3557167.1 ATP-binding cassette domain-containing protein [Chelatococcus sp.]
MTNAAGPLLSVRDLKVHFRVRDGRNGVVKAVDGISFDVPVGRTVALVGESGCGKSTTAYGIIGLEPVTSGSVIFDGREIAQLDRKARRALATDMQIVFQDPSAALNPKMTIGESIAEPLIVQGWRKRDWQKRVMELLDRVGLPAAYAERTPNALSGGQRQRVVIARALALSPKLLVLDEPVSALDVSIRSQILNLLMVLQKELGLAYLFISHDLSVVRHIADEVIVMYLGTVAERGETGILFDHPCHPYTEALISAIPLPDPRAQRARERIILKGDLPSPFNPPAGCPFVSRCPIRIEPCDTIRPTLQPVESGTEAACIVRAPAAAAGHATPPTRTKVLSA